MVVAGTAGSTGRHTGRHIWTWTAGQLTGSTDLDNCSTGSLGQLAEDEMSGDEILKTKCPRMKCLIKWLDNWFTLSTGSLGQLVHWILVRWVNWSITDQ